VSEDTVCVLQVPLLSGIFLVLGLGNTSTMAFVLRQKIREKLQQSTSTSFSYKHKYRFTTNGDLANSRTPSHDKLTHDN